MYHKIPNAIPVKVRQFQQLSTDNEWSNDTKQWVTTILNQHGYVIAIVVGSDGFVQKLKIEDIKVDL